VALVGLLRGRALLAYRHSTNGVFCHSITMTESGGAIKK
jgi:hypothetical protein